MSSNGERLVPDKLLGEAMRMLQLSPGRSSVKYILRLERLSYSTVEMEEDIRHLTRGRAWRRKQNHFSEKKKGKKKGKKNRPQIRRPLTSRPTPHR